MKTEIGYRPDVDGLRAVAVLSVFLYHLGIPVASGGFVGVDVFFVISGYLISGIVLADASAGKFSFGDFYARRARRLAPALLATTALVFVVAAVMFAPEDLRRTSASAIATLLGVSNVYFWEESGYFDVSSILKPLLHTWSLAVELQFYLVWPAFLLLLHRFGQRLVRPAILAVVVAGTVASIWTYRSDSSAAFYLSPLRVHEFAVGALVACLDDRAVRSRLALELLFICGIGGILGAAWGFSDLTIFPGYAVLLPTIGTAAAIFAGARARSAALLRHPVVVHVGRVSYSLYLVHWPLIVFVHYALNRPLGPVQRLILFAVALGLAELSWRYVERPFRRPGNERSRRPAFYAGCVLLGVFTLVPATSAWLDSGWVWRFPPDLQAINSLDVDAQGNYVWKNFGRLGNAGFTTDKRHVLVIGDSQAADIVNVLVAAGFERKNEIITRTSVGECGVPFTPQEQGEAFWNELNSKSPALFDACTKQLAAIVDPSLISNADYIIVAYYWRSPVLGRIADLLRDFGKRTRAKIVLLGAKGFEMSSVQFVNQLGSTQGVEQLAAAHVEAAAREANQFIGQNFLDDFVNLLPTICPRPDFCHVLTPEGMPIYWDHTHLTNYGAEFIGRSFADALFPFLR